MRIKHSLARHRISQPHIPSVPRGQESQQWFDQTCYDSKEPLRLFARCQSPPFVRAATAGSPCIRPDCGGWRLRAGSGRASCRTADGWGPSDALSPPDHPVLSDFSVTFWRCPSPQAQGQWRWCRAVVNPGGGGALKPSQPGSFPPARPGPLGQLGLGGPTRASGGCLR